MPNSRSLSFRRLAPWLAGLAALASLFFAGCASTSLRGIDVALTDMQPVSASLMETEVALTLRYTNENVIPIGVSGSSHKLYLDGELVGTAVSDQGVGLPPLNSQTSTATLHLKNLVLLQHLLQLQSGGTQRISYRLESRLQVGVGNDTHTVSSTHQDTIDIKALTTALQGTR